MIYNKIHRYFFVMFFIVLAMGKVHAQSDQQLRNKITSALSSYYNTYDDSEVSAAPGLKDKAYIFGFAISINSKGMVDTVIFTNADNKILDSVVSFKNIRKMLMKEKKAFNTYANTVFVSTALVRKAKDKKIDNLMEFDNSFYNAMPDIEKIAQSKKIKLLPAFSLVQVEARSD